jgi:hypothetical protein
MTVEDSPIVLGQARVPPLLLPLHRALPLARRHLSGARLQKGKGLLLNGANNAIGFPTVSGIGREARDAISPEGALKSVPALLRLLQHHQLGIVETLTEPVGGRLLNLSLLGAQVAHRKTRLTTGTEGQGEENDERIEEDNHSIKQTAHVPCSLSRQYLERILRWITTELRNQRVTPSLLYSKHIVDI